MERNAVYLARPDAMGLLSLSTLYFLAGIESGYPRFLVTGFYNALLDSGLRIVTRLSL